MTTKKKKKVSKKKTSKKKATSKKKTSKKKTTSKKESLKTYVSLVLDRSGSMGSIKTETIEHFNEQIEKIEDESKDMETYVSLVLFNHDIEEKFFAQNVDSLKPLTNRTYNPTGSTSMFDAVGYIIDKMEKEIPDLKKENTAALVVILSDGAENSSCKYTRADVAERIQRLQETNRWTFAYLGANQDLSKITEDLNIHSGNVNAFTANSKGMRVATAQSVNSTSKYLRSRKLGVTSTQEYYADHTSSGKSSS